MEETLQKKEVLTVKPNFKERILTIYLYVTNTELENLSLDYIQEFLKKRDLDCLQIHGIDLRFQSDLLSENALKNLLKIMKANEDSLKILNLNLKELNSVYFNEGTDFGVTLSKNEIKVKVKADGLMMIEVVKQLNKIIEKIQKIELVFEERNGKETGLIDLLNNVIGLNHLQELSVLQNKYTHVSALFPFSLATEEFCQRLKSLKIDLMNVGMGAEGVKFLCPFLHQSTNLENIALNLRYNKLTNEDMIHIIDSLQTQQLKHLSLSLSSNIFREEGIKSIFSLLNRTTPFLISLVLDLKLLEFNETCWNDLWSNYQNLNQITSLSLSLPMVQFANPQYDIDTLSLAIQCMKSLKSLTLDFERSNLMKISISLFKQIETIGQLEYLCLNLIGTCFGERRLTALEDCIIAQEKTLNSLNLYLSLHSNYRGNLPIYLRLLNLLENIRELNKFDTSAFIQIKQQFKKVQDKLFLRRKLIYSLMALHSKVYLGAFKRKEVADHITDFLLESVYKMPPYPPNYIPPAPIYFLE